MWLRIRAGGGRGCGGGRRSGVRSCRAAEPQRRDSAAPSARCFWVAGQTWLRPRRLGAGVDAKRMWRRSRRVALAPPVHRVSRPRQEALLEERPCDPPSSQSRDSMANPHFPLFSLLLQSICPFSLQPVIRRAEICETEGKWQNWNPAPATHSGGIKAGTARPGPASTRPLLSRFARFSRWGAAAGHKILRQISPKREKKEKNCALCRVERKNPSKSHFFNWTINFHESVNYQNEVAAFTFAISHCESRLRASYQTIEGLNKFYLEFYNKFLSRSLKILNRHRGMPRKNKKKEYLHYIVII